MQLNELTISQASSGLKRKEFSVSELTEDCLKAIEEKNPDLNAYLEVFADAGKKAKEADGIVKEGKDLPKLLGIPFGIKDNILVEGERTTAGSRILENYIGAYDATVIRKLKKQGAIFLGKTNLDEFAMGSSTENSGFGPTRNPHDLSRVPGGSSGGSAASVAGNLSLGALGSDTGGSIRQPASFCGVVGLKPTYGAVSRHGLIAMASSLDQIGPLAKTVEDAQIIFEAIKGRDYFDSTSAGADQLDLEEKIPQTLKEVRVGIPEEYFGKGLDPDVEKIVKNAINILEKEGAQIKSIRLPHAKYALPAYYIIVPSEVSSNLARFDGIKYGFSEESPNLLETYRQSRAGGLGAETKRRIMLGTYVLSAGYYDAYYLKAQRVRNLISQDFKKAFEIVDIIIGPATPSPAFKFGEKTGDPLQMYLEDIYTVALNLAGVPGISLPAGFARKEEKKLPVGVQLIGSWFSEKKLLAISKLLEILLKN